MNYNCGYEFFKVIIALDLFTPPRIGFRNEIDRFLYRYWVDIRFKDKK